MERQSAAQLTKRAEDPWILTKLVDSRDWSYSRQLLVNYCPHRGCFVAHPPRKNLFLDGSIDVWLTFSPKRHTREKFDYQ